MELPKRLERRVFFPLSLKLALSFILALLPFWILYEYGLHSGTFAEMVDQLLSLQIDVYGWGLSFSTIGFACLCVVSLLIALAASGLFVVAPIRRLLAWLRLMRERDFQVVPPLPHIGFDEINLIGQEMQFAAVQITKLRGHSEALGRQKTTFAAMISHELRTPLTSLLWAADQLQDPSTPQETREQLSSNLSRSLERMRLTIERIISISTIEEGRFGYVFELVDIVPLIEHTVEQFRRIAREREIAIEWMHGQDLQPIYADKVRISLVLFDLISNAIDYTPKNGRVSITAERADTRIKIEISDTGIGIADQERPFLFTQFYRSDRARKMHPDGSGLGLYLARNIINRHGSEIELSSIEGRGTRASFFLDSDRAHLVPG